MQTRTYLQSGGYRVLEKTPDHAAHSPLFTVVTVVFNRKSEIEQTIHSVIHQDFAGFEYVIVDGGSSDGTLDVLRQFEDRISLWISEPDQGVYDAFNKAVRATTGQWTLFLGAGDVFHNTSVLGDIAEAIRNVDAATEMVYGRVEIVDRDRKPTKTLNRAWSQMGGRWMGGRPMLPHHQGVFHSRAMLRGDEPFDINYRIAADSKVMYQSILHRPPHFVDVTVASVSLGGLSTEPKYFMVVANEIVRINREFRFGHYGHQVWYYVKTMTKYAIFHMAGESASKFWIDKYRQMTGRSAKWAR